MEPANIPVKITDPKIAHTKAEHYCAYQERSQQEVRDKLYAWGLWPDAVEQIIAGLIADNFLNEERFAKTFAQSKFNQKGWGRIKIKQALKLKKVPEVLIKKALQTIDAEAYTEKLEQILQKKATNLSEKDTYKRRYKLQQYAISRGFENDLIFDILNNRHL